MNSTRISFLSRLENEVFIRTAVIGFLMPLNPTITEITEIKTVLTEAVVNAMIHGYEQQNDKEIIVNISYDNKRLIQLEIIDYGKGIIDIDLARQPLYTTKADLERSGMGFTIMETFADKVVVESVLDKGTRIYIEKQLIDNE